MNLRATCVISLRVSKNMMRPYVLQVTKPPYPREMEMPEGGRWVANDTQQGMCARDIRTCRPI